MTPLILRHLLLSGIGSGVLLLAALALRCTVRRDAVLRYRLMVAGLFGAISLLPLQALVAEVIPRHALPPLPATAMPLEPVGDVAPVLAYKDAIASPIPSPARPEPMVVRLNRATRADYPALLLWLYLTGTVVVLGFHAFRAGAASRLLRQARPVTDGRARGLWAQIVADLRHPPELLECAGLHAPACRASGRPAVILPPQCAGLDEDMLAACFQHELIHLRRRDGVVALLAAALTVLLWFQPLVWVFIRILAIDRELSCDALVVRATRRPRSYALALLRFCDPTTAPRHPAPLMGFESARSIRRRITMLAHALQPFPRSRSALVLGVGVAMAVVGLSAHAVLTVAAGPGPALSGAVAGRLSSPPFANGHLGKGDTRSETIDAPAGRSDMQVYQRLIRIHEIPTPNPLVDWASSWEVPTSEDQSVGACAAQRRWVIDQETVLSAADGQVGDELRAPHIHLRLPSGSKLSMVLEGRSIFHEAGNQGHKRIIVTDGTLRVVDETGVARTSIRAASDRKDATLILTNSEDGGGLAFDVTAGDGVAPLSIRADTTTGVPEGEGQPPHGAVRWNLDQSNNAPGASELKMRWIYDLRRLHPEGC